MNKNIRYEWTWGLLAERSFPASYPPFVSIGLIGSPYQDSWVAYEDDDAWNTWNMITKE